MASVGEHHSYACKASLEMHSTHNNNRKWEIYLRRDLNEWYDEQRRKGISNLHNVWEYLDQIIKRYEHNNSEQSDRVKTSEKIDELHTLHTCQETISNGRKCGFFVSKLYWIIENDEYCVDASNIREQRLIVSPRTHVNNEKWVGFIRIFQDRRVYVEI